MAITTARRLRLLELRKAGVPYREIGRSVGIAEARARRDVAASLEKLDELSKEVAGELRALELERLDDIYHAVHKRLRGKTLFQAADRLVRIVERQCKLLGLDAPEIVEHGGGIDLAAQMDELGRQRWLEVAPILARLESGGFENQLESDELPPVHGGSSTDAGGEGTTVV